MRRRILHGVILIVVGMVFLTISCARYTYVNKSIYVEPPFDYKFIKKMAVLEFSNSSSTPGAGKIMADKFEQYMVEWGYYKVITRMDLDQILREHNLRVRGSLSSTTTKKIWEIAGVDALIVGNVQDYRIETRRLVKNNLPGYRRTATVTFTFKILKTMTGEVVWSKTAHGQHYREASENYLEYLDRESEYDYFKNAIHNAMWDHVTMIGPHVSGMKVRVKKKKK